jgi:hypothetical protein
MSSPPFVDRGGSELNMGEIRREAVSLVGLIVLFALLALVSFPLGLLFDGRGIAVLFTVAAQFVLAAGTGIVLMYVVARGIQLAGLSSPLDSDRHR